MSYHASLALVLFVAAVILIALIRLYRWHTNNFLRISNAEINAHRVTPRFTVGGDAK